MENLQARCVGCGRAQPAVPVPYRCAACGANLEILYDYDRLAERVARDGFVHAADRSLWRYRLLLPVDERFRSGLDIGLTPLRDGGIQDGVELLFKDETRHPSGSFKDRASEIAVAVARAAGAGTIVAASTGNAASSLACIAAVTGRQAMILVPHTIPRPKLVQIRAYGARTVPVQGSYDDAFDLSVRLTERHGWYNRNTGYNPFTREGKKTCAYEIAEQLDWSVPDWVLIPTGDGNILSGLWKGFRELLRLGVTDRCPRLCAVQACGSNGLAAAVGRVRSGGALSFERRPARSVADSITVDLPRDGQAAAAAILDSRGEAVEVTDQAIMEAQLRLARRWGLFAEPSGAAALAGFDALLRTGRLQPGARAVCLVTGSGFKDIEAVARALPQDAPVALDALLSSAGDGRPLPMGTS